MEIARPEAIVHPVRPTAGGEAAPAKEASAFEEVMASVKSAQGLPELSIEEVGRTSGASRREKLTSEKAECARQPGGIERLGLEIERGNLRLQELLGQLQGGRTYSPQELLGLQAEISDITLQVEVTTRVVAEATSSLRSLMQQQA